METVKFNTLPVKEMSIDDLHTVTANAIEVATPVKTAIGTLPAAVLEAMIIFNASMGDNRNRVTKSTKTAKVQAADKQRDKWDAELNRKVTSACKSMVETEKEAGLELKTFLTPYWDVARQSIPTETDSLKEMLAKYNDSADLQAYAATIGVTGIFTQLGATNLETETLYNNRSDEKASNAGPSATSFKDDVATTYNDFCILIEKAVTYTPSTELTTLFNKLNDQRNKFAVKYNASAKDNEVAVASGTADEATT